MNAEFEAPNWEAPAVGLIAGATASVMSSALAGMRNADAIRHERNIEEWINAAHVMRSAYEQEQGLRRQAQMTIQTLEEELAEARAGLARLTLALRR